MASAHTSPVEAIAQFFANAISSRSIERMAMLMTEDHVFIDSLGTRMEGKERVAKAFAAYFRMVPDYAIDVQEVFSNGSVVAMIGSAHGTYSPDGSLPPENAWSTPAAWRVVVQDGLVAEWRVYADNEPIRQVMARNRK
jgi:uncharacterized protein (TIGR02246 family)